MKRTILLLALTLLCVPAFGQSVWRQKLPLAFPNNRPLSDVRIENGRYLVAAGGQVFEFSPEGTVSGYVDRWNQSTNHFHSLYIQRKTNTQTGQDFFVTLTRSLFSINQAAYRVNILRPGTGYESPLLLSDSLLSSNNGGPAVVEINDHTFWVLGRRFVRQITVSSDASVSLDWEIPLSLPAGHVFNTAILQNNRIYAGTNQGLLVAFGLDGNILWSKDYQNLYAFRGMLARTDGFLACGSNNSTEGVLLAFDEAGNLQWERKPGDDGYNSLVEHPDGSIVATGIHSSGRASLTKINAGGQLLWRRIYEPGQGGKLLQTPDGGYLFTAHSIASPAAAWVVKTNDAGEAGMPRERFLAERRELVNGGFRMVQSPSSTLFVGFNDDGGLFIPADSTTTVFFSHAPWVAALDAGGNLHLSASEFGENNFISDYQTGIAGSPDRDFARLWAVTREELKAAQRDFAADGVLNQTPAYDLLTWPAKGNPYFNTNVDFTRVNTHPDSFPAPFTDRNGDGRYNVYDGDLPVLKGDRMLWWVFNDQKEHALSNGQPLNMDVMATAYAYDCDENDDVQQSVFVEYQLINRSSETYFDAYFGFRTDGDLGCFSDDLIGSMPETNTFYVYNEDAVDGSPGSECAGGIATFQENVPVECATFLNKSLDHLIYYNQDGQGGSGPGAGDPSVPLEYYTYLKGSWDEPLTYGGTGYNPDDPNAIPVNHAFSDNPADPQGWSMCSEMMSSFDQVILSSHGPFNLMAGDTFSLRMVFSHHPDIPHPCPDIFGLVKPAIQQIQQWHDDGTLDAPLDLGGVLVLPPGQSVSLDATLPNATAYEWSNGASSSAVSVNMAGEYTVSVTRASGCVATETVLVQAASAVQTPAPAPEWHLQPNPARDVLNIVLAELQPETTLRLLNAQGQTVAVQSFQNERIALPVAHLPAGLYWVELLQDGRRVGSRKVVVAR